MKIHSPLDAILDNETKIKILRFLFKTNAEWNGRQIANEIGVSAATVHKALHGLHKAGVLHLRNMGKTHIYTLNERSFAVSGLLKPLFIKEGSILRHMLNNIKRKIEVSRIKSSLVSVVLFGSVKTSQDHPTSDIDLMVVVKDTLSKPKVELFFEELDKKVSGELGNTLSAYINTIQEFKAKKKNGLAVIKNILKSHTLIYGKPLERIR